MKNIFLILTVFLFIACASKKVSSQEDIPPKKAEILCKVDDRV